MCFKYNFITTLWQQIQLIQFKGMVCQEAQATWSVFTVRMVSHSMLISDKRSDLIF